MRLFSCLIREERNARLFITLKAQRLKKINLVSNFHSRSKTSILLEMFNLDLQNSPQEVGVWWPARLTFSIVLENLNPGGRS